MAWLEVRTFDQRDSHHQITARPGRICRLADATSKRLSGSKQEQAGAALHPVQVLPLLCGIQLDIPAAKLHERACTMYRISLMHGSGER